MAEQIQPCLLDMSTRQEMQFLDPTQGGQPPLLNWVQVNVSSPGGECLSFCWLFQWKSRVAHAAYLCCLTAGQSDPRTQGATPTTLFGCKACCRVYKRTLCCLCYIYIYVLLLVLFAILIIFFWGGCGGGGVRQVPTP